uniref:Uncharacterized protein n=1 Tax=Cannabis sativa TaxID=3483 RepID=A0A803QWS6_CANSA
MLILLKEVKVEKIGSSGHGETTFGRGGGLQKARFHFSTAAAARILPAAAPTSYRSRITSSFLVFGLKNSI